MLVLTTYHVDETVDAALRAGAAGHAWLDPAVARRLIDDVVARPPNVPSPAALSSLTPREREVLALVAYGLSNVEIAERLVLGEATVKTHLGHILSKLDLRDRSRAIVLAYRTGLVTV